MLNSLGGGILKHSRNFISSNFIFSIRMTLVVVLKIRRRKPIENRLAAMAAEIFLFSQTCPDIEKELS